MWNPTGITTTRYRCNRDSLDLAYLQRPNTPLLDWNGSEPQIPYSHIHLGMHLFQMEIHLKVLVFKTEVKMGADYETG